MRESNSPTVQQGKLCWVNAFIPLALEDFWKKKWEEKYKCSLCFPPYSMGGGGAGRRTILAQCPAITTFNRQNSIPRLMSRRNIIFFSSKNSVQEPEQRCQLRDHHIHAVSSLTQSRGKCPCLKLFCSSRIPHVLILFWRVNTIIFRTQEYPIHIFPNTWSRLLKM